jgi:hypothetical protein
MGRLEDEAFYVVDEIGVPILDVARKIPMALVNSPSVLLHGISKLRIREMGSRYLFIVLYCYLFKFLSLRVTRCGRTVATGMADRLGVQPHIIEAVLNHVSGHKGGVAGIYNRAQYLTEKKQALTLWADYVMALVEGRPVNVVPMQRLG